MKLIGYLNAVAAARQVPEEYNPDKLPSHVDLISSIRDAFSFHTYPDIIPGVDLPDVLVFAAGKYSSNEESFGIGALLMEQNGDIAQTLTTDQADRVLDGVANVLDEKFGYKLKENTRPRVYTSSVVVEFDSAIEDTINQLGAIVSIMAHTSGSKDVSLRKLGFGKPPVPSTDQVSLVELAEFSIERRINTPIESNRYYCSAPLRTDDHVSMLREIEALLIASKA